MLPRCRLPRGELLVLARGAVDEFGRALPQWLGEFLRRPDRIDVLSKLGRSAAPDRHVFIIAALGGTPWSVESYLLGDLEHIPSEAPDLPHPLTAASITAAFGSQGLYWNGSVWRTIATRGDAIEGPAQNWMLSVIRRDDQQKPPLLTTQ